MDRGLKREPLIALESHHRDRQTEWGKSDAEGERGVYMKADGEGDLLHRHAYTYGGGPPELVDEILAPCLQG